MNIGLYFGSFNPVHHGHLIIANFVLQRKDIDQVWMVVSPKNPFKNEKQLLNEHFRYELLKLALEGEVNIKASKVEFNLPKPSYTAETMVYLTEKYPEHNFKIIVGGDSFQNLEKWKNADYLKNNFSFLVYPRKDFELEKSEFNYEIIEMPLLDISSTLIRKLIREQKSVRYLLPDLVNEEILKQLYYRDKLNNESEQ